MIKLRYKLGLFNVLSKIVFGVLFILLMPVILEQINTIQTDNELIEKREQVIDIIAEWGVEFLLHDQQDGSFGSYNILKEEYISLEWVEPDIEWNFIEVTQRMVENEIIDYRVLNYSFLVDGENYLLEIGKSLSSIRQTEKNIRTFTLVFLLLFILISLISDFSFASKLVKPLETITSRLKKTTSPSLFNPSPLTSTTSEFVYLDNTIRELMQKMDGLFQNEKQTTANISHELLTPISILRSKLENLQAHPDINDEAAAKIEESLKTIYRLKTMVNSLMFVARVESHQYLKEDNFTANEILQEILDELAPMFEDKSIHIHSELETIIPVQKANKALIFTMFYNIVNNAIKFTPENGHISIKCVRSGMKMSVNIKDSGCGMDQNQIHNLFKRFKKKLAPDNKGSGIGLAISKSIADFHQINIEVISEPGKGSEFIFHFNSKVH